MAGAKEESHKIKEARRDYTIVDIIETGMVLTGTEIKVSVQHALT